MSKQALEILKGYITCEDNATRNKFYNLLDSFWHKTDGKVLKETLEGQDGSVTFKFLDENGATSSITIPALPNSKPISFITGLSEALGNKVEKVPGKQLSTEDFTTELFNKLNALVNYVHPEFHQISEVEGLAEALAGLEPPEGFGFSEVNFSPAYEQKLLSYPIGHYAAPVADLTALALIPEQDIPNFQRRPVQAEKADYFYDRDAVEGDVAPDDQTEGTGFWVRASDANLESRVNSLEGSSFIVKSFTAPATGANQVFTFDTDFFQITDVKGRIGLLQSEWEGMPPNQIKIIPELEAGEVIEVGYWLNAFTVNAPYETKAEAEAKRQETFTEIKQVTEAISAGEGGKAYDTLADAQAVDPKPQDGTIFTVLKSDSENAGYHKFDSTQQVGTKFIRKFIDSDFFKIKGGEENVTLDLRLGCVIYQTGAFADVTNYYATQAIPVKIGDKITYEGYITSSKSICGYDSQGTFIRAFLNLDGSEIIRTGSFEITDERITYIIASVDKTIADTSGVTLIKESLFTPNVNYLIRREIEAQKVSEVYVSISGDDNNVGNENSPFKTINTALAAVKSNGGKVVIKGGVYRESIDFNLLKVNQITLCAYKYDNVKVFGSTEFVPIKSQGYNNIYEIESHLVENAYKGYRIFRTDKSSLPTDQTKMYPQMKGCSHRLPYEEYTDKNTKTFTTISEALTFMDSDTNSHIYYDSENSKIYIKDASNEDLSIIPFEVQTRDCTLRMAYERQNLVDVNFRYIDFLFSTNQGVHTSGLGKVEFNNCRAFGCGQNGFYDGSVIASYSKCESAGNGRDGFNGHFTDAINALNTTTIEKGNNAVYNNCWAHDNGDDGFSHHERGLVTHNGCLSSNNGWEGFAYVNGAGAECYNCIAEANAGIGFNIGSGINDGRSATTMLCFDCVSDNNKHGFDAQGSTDNTLPFCVMKVFRSISVNNTGFGYVSRERASIYLVNSTAGNNSSGIKSVVGEGIFVIDNSEIVTAP